MWIRLFPTSSPNNRRVDVYIHLFLETRRSPLVFSASHRSPLQKNTRWVFDTEKGRTKIPKDKVLKEKKDVKFYQHPNNRYFWYLVWILFVFPFLLSLASKITSIFSFRTPWRVLMIFRVLRLGYEPPFRLPVTCDSSSCKKPPGHD